jgi:hypothetical protein
MKIKYSLMDEHIAMLDLLEKDPMYKKYKDWLEKKYNIEMNDSDALIQDIGNSTGNHIYMRNGDVIKDIISYKDWIVQQRDEKINIILK